MNYKAILAVSIFSFGASPTVSMAQTLWCDVFGLGCVTPEEQRKRCVALAAEIVEEARDEIAKDPTIVGTNGFRTVREYLMYRYTQAQRRCVRMYQSLD